MSISRAEYLNLSKESHTCKVATQLQELTKGEWKTIDQSTEIETNDIDEAFDTYEDLLDPQISYLYDFRVCEKKPNARRNLITLYVDDEIYTTEII